MKRYSGYLIALLVAVLVAIVILPAYAESEEVREAVLDHFDLQEGTFFLRDEEGHLWEFELEEGDYHIGDKYLLHLPVDGDPWYERVNDRMTLIDLLQILAGLMIVFIGGGAVFCTAAKCDRRWN